MNSVWTRLPCCLSKRLHRRNFLDFYLITVSRVRNFGNTSAMRAIFFFENFKDFIYISKLSRKSWEKVFLLKDKCISIGNLKLSLLRREYFCSAVNVLKNNPETFSNLIAFTVINKYRKSGVIQISALFDPIYHVDCRRVLWKTTF